MKRKIISYLIVFAALMLVVAAVLWHGRRPAAHYRAHHDAESLYAALYNHVSEGDTPAQIQKLLGPGEPQDQKGSVEICRKLAVKVPQSYPDGIQDEDMFLGYQLGPGGMLVLQFRDGHLVNFVREQFAEYEPMLGISSE